jgi:fructose-bisphosphate aldolase class II
MTERVAAIDLELIARLRDAVPVPLVLHGSSGVSDELIARGIRAGLTKINVSTHLNARFTGAVRGYLDEHPTAVDSRTYLAAGRDAVEREAARLLELFAMAGKEPNG